MKSVVLPALLVGLALSPMSVVRSEADWFPPEDSPDCADLSVTRWNWGVGVVRDRYDAVDPRKNPGGFELHIDFECTIVGFTYDGPFCIPANSPCALIPGPTIGIDGSSGARAALYSPFFGNGECALRFTSVPNSNNWENGGHLINDGDQARCGNLPGCAQQFQFPAPCALGRRVRMQYFFRHNFADFQAPDLPDALPGDKFPLGFQGSFAGRSSNSAIIVCQQGRDPVLGNDPCSHFLFPLPVP